MICSISRKGKCYDNAVLESFFHTLKAKLNHLKRYKTRQQAKNEVFEDVEFFYNRQRMHSKLKDMSPFEYKDRKKFA